MVPSMVPWSHGPMVPWCGVFDTDNNELGQPRARTMLFHKTMAAFSAHYP